MSARWRLNWRDAWKVAKSAAPYVAGAVVDIASSGGIFTLKAILIGVGLKVAHQIVKDEPDTEKEGACDGESED